MQTMNRIFFYTALLLLCACEPAGKDAPENTDTPQEEEMPNDVVFYRGADLSYVNEMVDCGAVYYNESGNPEDPYAIFSKAGTDLIRVRLWHQPDWTDYSDYEDVKKTISKAKALGMQVLLDFHYSDDWTDPGKQKVPAAWLPVVNDTQLLGDSLYNYTYHVLNKLNKTGLLPEFIQVGNEINAEILQDPGKNYHHINWARNATLINRGIQAVRDASSEFGKNIQVMLHIAQPENGLWWFEQAKKNGISDYDWIGLSYYPLWSSYTIDNLPAAIETLIKTYHKRLMVVETAYPFTLNNADDANNILDSNALITGYPASAKGQYDYLKALEKSITSAGGEGLIYWEPAWVSTSCRTQWGQGSHWDNATLFDHDYRVTLGMEYYNGK